MSNQESNQVSAQASDQTSATDQDLAAKVAELERQIQELQSQKEEWQKNYLYLRAEFDNFRRHVEKERQNWRLYGPSEFIRELLEIVDNFERALAHPPLPSQVSHFMQGIQMISKEIHELLSRHGVKPQDCENQPYDPHLHEAIGQDHDPQRPDGVVLKVLKKPYFIHDKLLRVGQVIVNKASTNQSEGGQSNQKNSSSQV